MAMFVSSFLTQSRALLGDVVRAEKPETPAKRRLCVVQTRKRSRPRRAVLRVAGDDDTADEEVAKSEQQDAAPKPEYVAVPAGDLGIERARDLCTGLYTASIIWQSVVLVGEIVALFKQKVGLDVLLLATYRQVLKVLVGVMLYVSREAVLHNRTKSETYRRINLALIAYSTVNIYGMQNAEALLGMWRAFPAVKGNPSLGGAYITYFATLLTWWTAVGGGFKAVEVLLQRVPIRILKSIADISVTSWKKVSFMSVWYAFALGVSVLIGGLGAFASMPLGLSGASEFAQFVYRVMNREALVILVPVYFTLWDAAQRDRLGASTFKYLRAALGIMDLARGGLVFFLMRSGFALQLPAAMSLAASYCMLLFYLVSGVISLASLIRKIE